jgi:hypothetical protein
VAFEITIVISCCEAHLVGVRTFDEGGGTDGSDVGVVEGDDALSSAAGEMGCGAFRVGVIGGPTEAASAVVRALTTVMSRVLTMTG